MLGINGIASKIRTLAKWRTQIGRGSVSKKKVWYRKMVENVRCYCVAGAYLNIKNLEYLKHQGLPSELQNLIE